MRCAICGSDYNMTSAFNRFVNNFDTFSVIAADNLRYSRHKAIDFVCILQLSTI